MLASVATSFQSADYFALMILGLTAVSAFAGRGGVLKALLMVVLGLMLATVGTDQTSGVQRFTFGSLELLDGIEFLMLAMATFALTEALSIILTRDASSDSLKPKMIGFKSLKVTKKEFKLMLQRLPDPPSSVFLSEFSPVRGQHWALLWPMEWNGIWHHRKNRPNLVKGVCAV
jgi:TctA family transporter